MITREEYELLKEYRRLGYKWIAREKNGLVYAHKYKPFKDDPFWLANGLAYTIVSTPTGNIFKSITWEDEKPTKIDDLIRDYESHQEITGGSILNDFFRTESFNIKDVPAFKDLLSSLENTKSL